MFPRSTPASSLAYFPPWYLSRSQPHTAVECYDFVVCIVLACTWPRWSVDLTACRLHSYWFRSAHTLLIPLILRMKIATWYYASRWVNSFLPNMPAERALMWMARCHECGPIVLFTTAAIRRWPLWQRVILAWTTFSLAAGVPYCVVISASWPIRIMHPFVSRSNPKNLTWYTAPRLFNPRLAALLAVGFSTSVIPCQLAMACRTIRYCDPCSVNGHVNYHNAPTVHGQLINWALLLI